MLEFLEIKVNETTMQCVMKYQEGLHHRPKRALNFTIFSKAREEKIESLKTNIYTLINMTKPPRGVW